MLFRLTIELEDVDQVTGFEDIILLPCFFNETDIFKKPGVVLPVF